MLKNRTIPEIISLNSDEFNSLTTRISSGKLNDNDQKIMLAILNTYQWLQTQLQTTKLNVQRLKKIFGFTTEKHIPSQNNIGDVNSLFDLENPSVQPQTTTNSIEDVPPVKKL